MTGLYHLNTWSPETPLFFGQKAYLAFFYSKGCFFRSFALVARIWPYKTSILSINIENKAKENVFGRMTTFFGQSLLTKKKQCFGAPGTFIPESCSCSRISKQLNQAVDQVASASLSTLPSLEMVVLYPRGTPKGHKERLPIWVVDSPG